MGEEWLNRITQILEQVQIPCVREFTGADAPDVTRMAAAVGIRDLDWSRGIVIFSVTILSPRDSGGWFTQQTAVRAVTALEEQHISARMERMEYRRGCDCLAVPIRAELCIREEEPAKPVPRAWTVSVDGTELPFAVEFGEEQDLQRRLVGSVCDGHPVSVTPGIGGWKLRLVQQFPAGAAEPQVGPEPLEITLVRENRSVHYTGCCRNRTVRRFADGMLTVETEGFALGRTEDANG